MDKENRMWLQRSKTHWAVQGDRNTRYFHSRATKWYRKNYIHRLRRPDGQWSSSKEKVDNIIVKYYNELYTSTAPSDSQETLLSIHTLVSAQMNDKLSAKLKAWDVHAAVKQMAPLKVPGSDGMSLVFFQKFWPLIGDEVTDYVLHLLNTATFPPHLNHTFISQIPKIQNPELVSEFRPISLCNVLYKIFFKVLANRLKKILPTFITEHQSAFTKSRLISDNILVAFENLHSMQNHKSDKEGYMTVKLDMSKTYDWVEWSFLEVVMRRMGFTERWIQLMMVGVTSVSYSILVNGEPKGLIKPSRGIRQGDPLSPFLFLLCTEGLHGLISQVARQGDLIGYSLCKNGPKLTNLFFADDSLLFCRSIPQECEKVLEILDTYSKCSGLYINKSKTTIFFSKSTTSERKQYIKEVLSVPEIRSYEKYLGLPSLIG